MAYCWTCPSKFKHRHVYFLLRALEAPVCSGRVSTLLLSENRQKDECLCGGLYRSCRNQGLTPGPVWVHAFAFHFLLVYISVCRFFVCASACKCEANTSVPFSNKKIDKYSWSVNIMCASAGAKYLEVYVLRYCFATVVFHVYLINTWLPISVTTTEIIICLLFPVREIFFSISGACLNTLGVQA